MELQYSDDWNSSVNTGAVVGKGGVLLSGLLLWGS